eukprot:748846-Hanusia_phi.AAC.3
MSWNGSSPQLTNMTSFTSEPCTRESPLSTLANISSCEKQGERQETVRSTEIQRQEEQRKRSRGPSGLSSRTGMVRSAQGREQRNEETRPYPRPAASEGTASREESHEHFAPNGGGSTCQQESVNVIMCTNTETEYHSFCLEQARNFLQRMFPKLTR